MKTHLDANFLSPVIRVGFPFLIQESREDTFTKGNLCPAFRQIGGQKTLSTSAVSQLPSDQNNPYAKVADSEVA